MVQRTGKIRLDIPLPFVQDSTNVDFSLLRVFRLDEADIGQLLPVRSMLFNRERRLLLRRSLLSLKGGEALKEGSVVFV